MKVRINIERLKADILSLSKIGYQEKDCGIYRPGFSENDMLGREWLVNRIKDCGFEGYMDDAGNVIGRMGPGGMPVVACGSHIDTVPCGGMFDGTLGVLAGLEAMRVIQENNIELKYPVELIAFSEEEGRFGGMFGVQAICGQIKPDWLEVAQDADGLRLKDAMRQAGLDPIRSLNVYRDRRDFHGFVELHIEQGPVLEKIGKPIGVVEGISGVFKWMVRLIGKAGHAGTAPMEMRSDAFMGLADFAHEIPRIIEEEGTDKSRLTVGKVDLKPGFPHTIPGEADFTLVGRDMSSEVMKALADTCRKALSAIARRHNLMFEYQQMSWLEPRACHPEIVELFARKANDLGYDHERMVSGAGHDTQFMTEITRSGMIFVPSVGGVSHAPDEWTHWKDIDKGANLLLSVILELTEGK